MNSSAQERGDATPVSVFISYAHDDDEHRLAVRRLQELLIEQGFEARTDQDVEHQHVNWADWTEAQVTQASFVLVVASPKYYESSRAGLDPDVPRTSGLGVAWEVLHLRELVYGGGSLHRNRILPVLLPGHGVDEIPLWLAPRTRSYYEVRSFDPAGAAKLLSVLRSDVGARGAAAGTRRKEAEQGARDQPGHVTPGVVTVVHVAGGALAAGEVGPERLTRLAPNGADLLVVSGNVTRRARPKEFAAAGEQLRRITGALRVPFDAVVLAPGPGDVNLEECQAYFLQRAAADVEPEPPFYPKWRAWEEFLRTWRPSEATAAAPSFNPGQPWGLLTVDRLNTVVAALNSTMAWSHRTEDQHPALGDSQIRSLRTQLLQQEEQGLLRIGLVHHDVLAAGFADPPEQVAHVTGHLNVLLHEGDTVTAPQQAAPATGSLSGQPIVLGLHEQVAQVLKISSAGVLRYTVGRDGRTASTEYPVSPPHTAATFPPVAVGEVPVPGGGLQQAMPLTPQEEFALRVWDVCTIKHPGAQIVRVDPVGPEEAPLYLRVTSSQDGVVRQRPVGIVEGDLDEAVVRRFVDKVHRRFLAADPYLRSVLVYGGRQADAALVEAAAAGGVDVRSLVEFLGLIDLRRYLQKQTERLDNSTFYPPSTYVPQRFQELSKVSGEEPGPVQDDLLEHLLQWLGRDEQCFVLVLGEFGLGKTFVMQELARRIPERLPGLVPMLIELRNLEKARSVDELIAQHLAAAKERTLDLDAFRLMLLEGQIVLLFDGFDELALRVRYDQAAERLSTLLQPLEKRAKIVVSSRSQHFESSHQVRTALGDTVSNRGARLVELVGFNDRQIRTYLHKLYRGDDDRVERRLKLLADVNDLLGLSRNPRMLTFIGGIDDERLHRARAEDGKISSAHLYEQLIDQWLSHENWRATPRGAASPLTVDHRRRAVIALAIKLWQSPDGRVTVEELGHEAMAVLKPVVDQPIDHAEAAFLVGSGTLLVRDDEGRFSFIHQSIMEWLVAAHVAEELAAGRSELAVLGSRTMSALMADFLGGLVGSRAATLWARRVLEGEGGDTAKANARLVLKRMGERGPQQAQLQGHSLRGDALVGVALVEADLAGADLTQTRIVRTDLSRASLRGAVLDRAVLDRVTLSGADLREARITRSRLVDCDLDGTTLAGSTWTRTALLGALPDSLLAAPELAAAVVVGRDGLVLERAPALASARSVAFSPDGTLVVFAMGHTVVVADAETGHLLRSLKGHEDAVTAVLFTPDGGRLVSAGRDGRILRWRVEDAEPLPPRAAARGSAGDASPSGAAGAGDARVASPIQCLALAPDGARVLAGSADGTVTTWRLDDLARPVHVLQAHEQGVTALALAVAAPGQAAGAPAVDLATAHADGEIRLWRLADLAPDTDPDGPTQPATQPVTPVRTLPGTGRTVEAIAFQPGGDLLAGGGGDGFVRLWTASTGVLRRTLQAHGGRVRDVAFDPGGQVLASAGTDGLLRLWDVADASLVATLTGHTNQVRTARFSADGRWLVSGGDDGTAIVWSAAAHNSRTRFTGRREHILEMAGDPSGRLVATGGDDGCLRLWRPAEGTCTVHELSREPVYGVGFTRDGTLMAVGLGGGAVQVHRVEDGALQPSPADKHRSPVRHIAFSPDGSKLATAAIEGRVRIWGVQHGGLQHALASPTRTIAGLSFSPDGSLLATAGGDETVQLWDTDDGEISRRPLLTGRTRVVSAITFDPSGRYIGVGAVDGMVQLWAATGDFEKLADLVGHSDMVHAVAFTPDGSLLATAGADETVRVWSVQERRPLHVLRGHLGGVRDMAFCEGGLLATSGSDGVMLLWDTTTGRRLSTLMPLPEQGYAIVLPDGRYSIRGDSERTFWWASKFCRFDERELRDRPEAGVVRVSGALPPRS